jgi:ribosomal protein S6--L-glutamate ligase
MIIRGTAELEAHFHDLGPGDVVAGPLSAKYLQGALAADLDARGVRCVPSLLSQLLSRSKAAQATVFHRWMTAETRVVRRRAELIAAAGAYARRGIGAVVTKQEAMHCGHGVRLWDSVEALYNVVAFDDGAYPFVLQPFIPDITDVRVIWAGDHQEAYARENKFSFRANLAAGGRSRPCDLDAETGAFCRAVMERGRYPYAHIDLHILAQGGCVLSEITLEAGILGARIGRAELNRLKRDRIEALASGGE